MDSFSRHLTFLSFWGDFLVSFFLAARTSILLSLHSQSVYYGKSDNTGVITRQPHCRLTRITGLAYNTVVSIVRAASTKAQLVHNDQVEEVTTEEVSADEMWSFALKKQKQCLPDELDVGDCWIGISLADTSGLILAARVGKYTDELIRPLAKVN